jgi:hypothetical protein
MKREDLLKQAEELKDCTVMDLEEIIKESLKEAGRIRMI